jgi:hypothetical protein
MRLIDVAQDMENLRAFIDTVMNLQVLQSSGIFFYLTEELFSDV